MFSLFFKVNNEEICIPHGGIVEGFAFALNTFDFRNCDDIILLSIHYDGKLVYKSKDKKPLKMRAWVDNVFFFFDNKFIDKFKPDHSRSELLYLPYKDDEGWQSSIDIIETNFFYELVDKKYTCKETFLDVDFNYLRKQVYNCICKWIDEVLWHNLWLVKNTSVFDDEKFIINYIEDTGFLNKHQYEEIFKAFYFEYRGVIHMKEILKLRLAAANDFNEIGLIYMIGPARVLESLLSCNHTDPEIEKKAKYLSLIYKNLVNEGKL